MAKEQAILPASAARLPGKAGSSPYGAGPRARRRLHRRSWPALAMLFLLAECAAPTPPPPPSPPPVANPRPFAPTAPAPADWRDAPVTPGDWHWRQDGSVSTAWFGTSGAAPVALWQCPRGSGTVSLTVMTPAMAATSTAPSLSATIATTTLTRTWQADRVSGRESGRTKGAGGGSGAVLRMNAGDTMLDAMAFSRGRFMVAVEGMAPLYLPSWPEVSRVIEDCRASR